MIEKIKNGIFEWKNNLGLNIKLTKYFVTVFIIFNIIDGILTFENVFSGIAKETNPIMNFMFGIFGIKLTIAMKIVLLSSFVWFSTKGMINRKGASDKQKIIALLSLQILMFIMILLYAYVVAKNILIMGV